MMKTILYLACTIALAASTNITSVVDSITTVSDNVISGIDGVNQAAVTTGSNAAINLMKMGNQSADAVLSTVEQVLEDKALTAMAAMDGMNSTVYAVADALSSIPGAGQMASMGAKLADMGMQMSQTALLAGGNGLLNAMEQKKTVVSQLTQAGETTANLIGTTLKEGSSFGSTVGKGMNSLFRNTARLFG